MTTKLVVVEQLSSGVNLLKFNDPVNKNGFTEEMVEAVSAVLGAAAADREAKALIIAGLPDVFCSGGTIDTMQRLNALVQSSDHLALAKMVLDIPYPTIAAMEGHAVGGGLALALCADIVLMSRESRYAANFMNIGFTPGMGSTCLLEQIIPPAIARELMFTGEYRKGADFIGCSGVNYIFPRNQVFSKAIDLAKRIAEKPRLPLEILKRHFSRKRRAFFEGSVVAEGMMHTLSLGQSDIYQIFHENYVE